MEDVCITSTDNKQGQELTTVICGFDSAPRREHDDGDDATKIPTVNDTNNNEDLSLTKSRPKSPSSPMVNKERVGSFYDSNTVDQNFKSEEKMTIDEENRPSSKREKALSPPVQEVECLKEQLTFLTHQVLQLMHVLCINHCRCSSCNAFIDLAKVSQIFPYTNRLVNPVQNGLLQEQLVNHDESQSFEGDDAILEDDEDDTTSVRFSYGSKVDRKSKNNINQDCDSNNNNAIDRNDGRNKSLDLQEKDISDENGSPQNRPNTSLDEETSSNDNGAENFSPNDNALFNLCHSGIINSALIRNRRLIVGVDQLLPKLLAEQRDHSSSGPFTLTNGNVLDKYRQEENKSPTMEAENLTCRSRRRHFSPRTMPAGFGHGLMGGGGDSRSLASTEVSSSTSYYNSNVNGAAGTANEHQTAQPPTTVTQALNLADLLAATANDARHASSRKRRRYLEDSDQNQAALHCIDNASERACFVNESPNSSGGSLELPKTSLETSTNQDVLCVSDQLLSFDVPHERDPRFGLADPEVRSPFMIPDTWSGLLMDHLHTSYMLVAMAYEHQTIQRRIYRCFAGYLTALGPALSTGLPLVMPGPKTTTFFCTICNREFSNVYYKRHMIVHANSRPYVCDVCGKRFNERSNMMKHKQRLHEATSS